MNSTQLANLQESLYFKDFKEKKNGHNNYKFMAIHTKENIAYLDAFLTQ